MKKDICDRLKIFRLHLGLSQKEFADKLSMNQTQLSATELGKISVTVNTLIVLSNEFNVNLNWMVSGAGKMFNENKDSISIDDIIYKLEELKKQFNEKV